MIEHKTGTDTGAKGRPMSVFYEMWSEHRIGPPEIRIIN